MDATNQTVEESDVSGDEMRVAQINRQAVGYLEDLLLQLETGELSYDDMLATTYASMIACSILGFSLEHLAADASKAAQKMHDEMGTFFEVDDEPVET